MSARSTDSLFECGSACGSHLTVASPKGTPNRWGGSKGRDVDGGAPGAARAGPEGGGGGVRGGGDRGVAGAGRPAAERAGDAGPARGRRGRLALAGGRALARPAGRLAAVADGVRLVPALAGAGLSLRWSAKCLKGPAP